MLKTGQVVKAAAGRDKNRFFVVLDCDGVYAHIADGKRRRREHPKRKKCMHLRPTLFVAEGGTIGTNREIRKLLAAFGQGKGEEHEEV